MRKGNAQILDEIKKNNLRENIREKKGKERLGNVMERGEVINPACIAIRKNLY